MDKAERARGLAEPLAGSDCPPEAVVALAMVDPHGPHSLRPTCLHYHLMSNYYEHWAGEWHPQAVYPGVSGCYCRKERHLASVDYSLTEGTGHIVYRLLTHMGAAAEDCRWSFG